MLAGYSMARCPAVRLDSGCARGEHEGDRRSTRQRNTLTIAVMATQDLYF
jgi:hypothetical protein